MVVYVCGPGPDGVIPNPTDRRRIDREATAVVVLTGSGLKDPDAALKNVEPPIELEGDARTLAKVLKL